MRRQRLNSRFAAALAAAAQCCLLSSAHAVATIFNDGGSHIVNTSITPNSVEVRDGAGDAPTTVTVQAGAVIGSTAGSSISVFNNSILVMDGGTLNDELFLFNNATATVNGGSIADDITTNDSSHVTVNNVTNGDDLEARGSSTMMLNNGSHDEDIETFDSATVNVFGGMYQTGADGANVEAAGSSVINIHGGSFGVGQTDGAGAFNAIENGTINLHGGLIGGQPEGLIASGNGVINVFGVGSLPARLTAVGAGVINLANGAVPAVAAYGDGDVNVLSLTGVTGLTANEGVTINVYGSAFQVNGAPAPFGPVGAVAGFLSSGGGPNVNFFRAFTTGAQINLVAIPEPAGLSLLGAAGLGLIARRRRGR
jgi:hypothetical protein